MNEPQADIPAVFISCGQYHETERVLGQTIASLVSDLIPGVVGYFAQNENSLDALSRNVFRALQNAVGFVAIMHPRGTVSYAGGSSRVRGSVWIEQEIAIQAFMVQAQDKQLPAIVYVHEEIELEGLRQLLQLNQRFRTGEEVIEHFTYLVRDGRFCPVIARSEPETALGDRQGADRATIRVLRRRLRDVALALRPTVFSFYSFSLGAISTIVSRAREEFDRPGIAANLNDSLYDRIDEALKEVERDLNLQHHLYFGWCVEDGIPIENGRATRAVQMTDERSLQTRENFLSSLVALRDVLQELSERQEILDQIQRSIDVAEESR